MVSYALFLRSERAELEDSKTQDSDLRNSAGYENILPKAEEVKLDEYQSQCFEMRLK